MYGVTKKNSNFDSPVINSQMPSKGRTFACDKAPHTSALWHVGFLDITPEPRREERQITYKYAIFIAPKYGLYFVLTDCQGSVEVTTQTHVVNLNV
jgi:hypothetical protein